MTTDVSLNHQATVGKGDAGGRVPGDFPRPGPGKMAVRALLLRCPHCGSRQIFSGYFTLKDACPTCGLKLERGEHDFFLGAYMFNLIAVELAVFACMFAVVLRTWPEPPWELITRAAVFLTIAGCVVCYPFAKTTWLAADLSLRPLSPAELNGTRDSEDW